MLRDIQFGLLTIVMNAFTGPKVGVATQKFSAALRAEPPLSKFLNPPLDSGGFRGGNGGGTKGTPL